ncbi:MAG: hypothetical protein AAF570_27665 [Bacteroidota bacterium]
MKKIILSLGLLVGIFSISLADSPITSTGFAEAYKDHKMVKKAQEAGGLLNKKLMKYLAHPSKPIDIKMAIINAIGWDIDGKDNYGTYLNFIAQKRKTTAGAADFYDKLKRDDFLCLAYIKAMDNYFNVDEAMKLAEMARKANPNSYTCQIVTGLIFAQKAFDSDWCKVWRIVYKVQQNSNLEQDMKREAKKIIFDYMGLYKDECKS